MVSVHKIKKTQEGIKMNPFVCGTPHLVKSWKELRSSLAGKPEYDQLFEVMKFWSLAPLAKIAYDPETLDEYPSPWEMINANDWCENSIAVAMEFTLRLGGWDQSRLIIKMVKNYDLSFQKLVLFVDNKYALNYEYAEIVAPEKYDVMVAWAYNGRKYEKLS